MPTLFIVLIVLFILLIVFSIVFPIKYKRYIAENFKKKYQKKISKLAKANGLNIINNYNGEFAGSKVIADHILLSNKFLYLIHDKYFYGSIETNERDKSWVFNSYNSNEERWYLNNLIFEGNNEQKEAKNLFLIPVEKIIVLNLINDDCNLVNYIQRNENIFVTKLSKINKQFKLIESSKETTFDYRKREEVFNTIKCLNIK